MAVKWLRECTRGVSASLIVLSHWPHVAQQVQQQVAELVFAMYFNGTIHTSNELSNLCPSPFTLATCAATCCRTCGQCESTIIRCAWGRLTGRQC